MVSMRNGFDGIHTILPLLFQQQFASIRQPSIALSTSAADMLHNLRAEQSPLLSSFEFYTLYPLVLLTHIMLQRLLSKRFSPNINGAVRRSRLKYDKMFSAGCYICETESLSRQRCNAGRHLSHYLWHCISEP